MCFMKQTLYVYETKLTNSNISQFTLLKLENRIRVYTFFKHSLIHTIQLNCIVCVTVYSESLIISDLKDNSYLSGVTTALRPQECPKPLAVSQLGLPVRYPGLNGQSVSMRTTWSTHRSLASLIRCTTVRSPYISYSLSL